MTKIVETDWGYVAFETNELLVVSTVGDPPKVRMAAPSGLSRGAFSFNYLRPDGRMVEMILFQGKQDERTRNLPLSDLRTLAAEFTIHMNNGGDADANMVRILEARSDSIRFDVPITFPNK